MFITSVVSHLRGWTRLNERGPLLSELGQILLEVDCANLSEAYDIKGRIRRSAMPDRIPKSAVDHLFENRGWAVGTRVPVDYPRHHWPRVDYAKDQVLVEMALYPRENTESMLHTTLPVFYKTSQWILGVLLVPTAEVARQLNPPAGTFETIKARLETADRLQLRTSTVIAGFSADEQGLAIHELTSEVDEFLLKTINLPLNEAIQQREQQNYDFKEQLPADLPKTVCAMANELGGGLIIIGVSDDGKTPGIAGDQLDELTTAASNQIKNRCRPIPEFRFIPFPIPDRPKRFICILQIRETKKTPCEVDGRFYVRIGPTTQPAGPDKIVEITDRLRAGPV